jgi:hypothetical protein
VNAKELTVKCRIQAADLTVKCLLTSPLTNNAVSKKYG